MEGLATLNFVGLVIGSIAIFFYQRKLNNLKVASDTISLLQAQVNAQETALKSSQEEIKRMSDNLVTLKAQLEEKDKTIGMYLSIFQGRDGQTLDFQKKGFETMEKFNKLLPVIAETHKSAINNNKVLVDLSANMERLYKLMERHLQIIENTSITK